MARNSISTTLVKDVYRLIEQNALTVRKGSSVSNLLKKMVEDKKTRHAFVVDDNDAILGAIRLSSIISFLSPSTIIEEMDTSTDSYLSYFRFTEADVVEDIMDDIPVTVTVDSSVKSVLALMKEHSINELPVVDGNNKIIGEINIIEILAHYVEFDT